MTKFSTKVFAFGAVLVVLVVSFTGVKNGLFLNNILTKQYQSSVVDQTQLLAQKIQMVLTRWETKIGFFVQTILAIPEAQRAEALKILLSSEASVTGLLILNNSEKPTIIAEYFQNSKDKIDLQTIKNEMKYNQKVITFHPNNPKLAWIGKKINGGDANGDLLIVTTFQLKEISSSLEPNLRSKQKIYLLDHNLVDIVSRKSYETLQREAGHQLSFIQSALETLKKDLGAGFLGKTNSAGQPTMIAYDRFEGAPLRLVVHQSAEPIRRAIESFLLEMVQWSIFFLLFAILLAKLFVKGLLGGLAELFQATQKVAKGDFRVKVPVKSSDEVGRLSESFNVMTDKILILLEKEKEKVLIDQELATANAVQNLFFNYEPFKTPFLHIESYYKPASFCGGDWWGHFDLGTNRELVMIGDATGHGVPAALVTALAYSVASQFAAYHKNNGSLEINPGDLLTQLNDLLVQTLKGSLFMSFAALILDPCKSQLLFANGGHPFPFRLSLMSDATLNKPRNPEGRSDKTVIESPYKVSTLVPIANNGGILGVELGAEFQYESLDFAPGDRLILYSDGLIEIENAQGKYWGKQGLKKELLKIPGQSLPELRDHLVKSSIKYHINGEIFKDDVTVVLIENTTLVPSVLAA